MALCGCWGQWATMSQSTAYYVRRALNRVRDAVHEWDLPPTARAVRRERLTYLSPRKIRRIEESVSKVLKQGTPGDVLEFGVALGGSAIILAQHAANEGRRFHGFDVFGMIPPPISDKDDAKSKQRYEVIASGQSKGIRGETYYGYRQYLLDEVRSSFARHGVPVNDSTIVLHKGLFEESWPGYDGKTIAFAHIDCDWYDQVKF